jgi:hypothetical protein
MRWSFSVEFPQALAPISG